MLQLLINAREKVGFESTLEMSLYNTHLYKQTLARKLEEIENELNSEKKNALKRDKTIQGLTQVLREKENEVGSTIKNCFVELVMQPI